MAKDRVISTIDPDARHGHKTAARGFDGYKGHAAGLAPVDRQSGSSIRGASKSRGGNHRLKNAMFIAAFVASRHDPVAKAYYEKKRAEGKKHNAAIICLARRRCDLILAMLKTATPYNPPTIEAA